MMICYPSGWQRETVTSIRLFHWSKLDLKGLRIIRWSCCACWEAKQDLSPGTSGAQHSHFIAASALAKAFSVTKDLKSRGKTRHSNNIVWASASGLHFQWSYHAGGRPLLQSRAAAYTLTSRSLTGCK
jgi:hypothetical protein